MSRDQKPGKFKLVGGTAPNYGRRASDKVPGEPVGATPRIAARDEQEAIDAPRSRGLLLSLLYLLFCGIGGAVVEFFGLAGDWPR